MWAVFVVLFFFFVLFVFHLRFPFIYKQRSYQKWSVGLGSAPEVRSNMLPQTVLDYQYVQEKLGGDCVADPFLIYAKERYYLFVEHIIDNVGKISAFESNDFTNWDFCGLVLDEPFHLSYPQVFERNGDFYMIPETRESNSVRLYKATNFPYGWEMVCVLLDGQFVDATLYEHEGCFYMFVSERQSFLRCYVSARFDGGFVEHPQSPMGIGNMMRPAGTVFRRKGKTYLPVQDRKRGYGYAVGQLHLKKLTPQIIRYSKAGTFMGKIKHPMFADGNHHFCCVEKDGGIIFAIDGRVGTKAAHWRIQIGKSIRDNIHDLLTWLHIPYDVKFLKGIGF